MATPTTYLARDLVLYFSQDNGVSWEPFAGATEFSLTVGTSEVDITTFDSGNFEEFKADRHNITASGSFLQTFDTPAGKITGDDVMGLQLAKTLIKGRYALVSGGKKLEFTGFFNNTNLTSADKDVAKGSFEIRGTGTFTWDANTGS